MEKIRRHGAIPLFSWNSGASGGNPANFQLSDLRSGRYDGHIRAFARQARAWGRPFFLRFDWEMNGDWFPWGARASGNRPGEFRLAWRHVHRIFDRVGARNATWVWCPYARDEPLAPFLPRRPLRRLDLPRRLQLGAGLLRARPVADLPRDLRRRLPSYRRPRRPAQADAAGGGRLDRRRPAKATWIRRMFATLRRGFPKVHGLVWFDKVDKENDWPLESSSAASTAFARGLRHDYEENVFSRLRRTPIPAPRR